MRGVVQIFGYMRSGTSMCRRLLHKHPEIYITNEVGRAIYPQLVKFFRFCDAAFQDMPTTAVQGRWNGRRSDLLRDMWLGLSKFDEEPGLARTAELVGNKTPRAEFYWSELEEALGEEKPRYIYCLRDPEKILRSKMNMHLSGRDFAYSLRDLRRSLEKMLEIRAACPSRLYLFSVDQYAAHPYQATAALLSFLGVSQSPSTIRQMIAQPVANAMSQQIRSRIAAGEKVGAVVELTEAQVSEVRKCEICGLARGLLDELGSADEGRQSDDG